VRGAERREFDESRDAVRRTRLANERTYLAWWRTGLTSFAVSLGVGKIVPGLTDVSAWPYQVLGGGFALLGILCLAYGFRRERAVEAALQAGGFAQPDARATLALTCFGLALGVLTMVLIVSGR
jgi:putative membrane protein